MLLSKARGQQESLHRGLDGVPPPAAHAGVDGPPHVERHIVLPDVLHRIQRILRGLSVQLAGTRVQHCQFSSLTAEQAAYASTSGAALALTRSLVERSPTTSLAYAAATFLFALRKQTV